MLKLPSTSVKGRMAFNNSTYRGGRTFLICRNGGI